MSLKVLNIEDLESSMILEMISRDVSSLTSLKLKNIKDGEGSSFSSSCSNMESVINVLLKNNSQSLTKLHLDDCKGLKRLVLGVSLDSLWLDRVFDQIQSSTVVDLSSGLFSDELVEFPLPFSSSSSSIPNLIRLQLCGLENVRSIALVEQLQFTAFPALTELIISDFEGVRSLLLSIAKLPSLKILVIRNCKNLESLPMFDESHCLERLEISGCPILKERYCKGSGPEWFKIKHIPIINLGYSLKL
ncbi:hypothetical protein ACET3Z_026346 [Daucus carota]